MGSTYTKSRQAKSKFPKRRFVLEAPSVEGVFLFQGHPHREAVGVGTWRVGAWLARVFRHIITVL